MTRPLPPDLKAALSRLYRSPLMQFGRGYAEYRDHPDPVRVAIIRRLRVAGMSRFITPDGHPNCEHITSQGVSAYRMARGAPGKPAGEV